MSGVGIHGSEYPISKVFSDDFFFKVPHYQRPYAWGVDEASALFDDLLASIDDCSTPLAELDPYFLGSVVFVNR